MTDYKRLTISPEMVEELSKTLNIEAEYERKMWRVKSITPKETDVPAPTFKMVPKAAMEAGFKLPPLRTGHPDETSGKVAIGWNEAIKVIKEMNNL